jgi:hypothetical protein
MKEVEDEPDLIRSKPFLDDSYLFLRGTIKRRISNVVHSLCFPSVGLIGLDYGRFDNTIRLYNHRNHSQDGVAGDSNA